MRRPVMIIMTLILIFYCSTTVPIFGNNVFAMNSVKERSVTTNSSTQISGKLPYIDGLSNTKLQKSINSAIENVYNSKTQSKNLKSVEFSYEYKVSKDIHSLVIYSKVTDIGTKTQIDTVCFNTSSSNLLKITDVLGVNGVQIANKIIQDKMRKQPQVFYPDFDGISPDQSFFVENGIVKICFGQSEIAPINQGIIYIDVNPENIIPLVVKNRSYVVKDDYQLKMIPLREVCETFGYNVTWLNADSAVSIYKKDNFITIYPGKNAYTKGKNYPKSLESAPEIINGSMYVPLSFFELFLDSVYTVDSNDNIIFSYYDNATSK